MDGPLSEDEIPNPPLNPPFTPERRRGALSPPQFPVLRGTLGLRRSTDFDVSWISRWLNREGDVLCYYNSEHELQHIGVIELRNIEKIQTYKRRSKDRSTFFGSLSEPEWMVDVTVSRPERIVFSLLCKTEKECKYWVKGLKLWRRFFLDEYKRSLLSSSQQQLDSPDLVLLSPRNPHHDHGQSVSPIMGYATSPRRDPSSPVRRGDFSPNPRSKTQRTMSVVDIPTARSKKGSRLRGGDRLDVLDERQSDGERGRCSFDMPRSNGWGGGDDADIARASFSGDELSNKFCREKVRSLRNQAKHQSGDVSIPDGKVKKRKLQLLRRERKRTLDFEAENPDEQAEKRGERVTNDLSSAELNVESYERDEDELGAERKINDSPHIQKQSADVEELLAQLKEKEKTILKLRLQLRSEKTDNKERCGSLQQKLDTFNRKYFLAMAKEMVNELKKEDIERDIDLDTLFHQSEQLGITLETTDSYLADKKHDIKTQHQSSLQYRLKVCPKPLPDTSVAPTSSLMPRANTPPPDLDGYNSA